MNNPSVRALSMVAAIVAGLGLLLLMIGLIANSLGSGGGVLTLIGGGLLVLALLFYVAFLVTDAIVESIDRVRETIVARWIDDPEDDETPGVRSGAQK